MLKKFLKRILPHRTTITQDKTLKIFGPILHNENLWHLTRRSTARGAAIGVFICFIPVPLQTVLAAAFAIFFRANLLISIIGVWISNPLTAAPMLYLDYYVGAKILHRPSMQFNFELSWQWFSQKLAEIWLPLYLGSLISGAIFGSLAYFTVQLLWRLGIFYQRQNRKKIQGRS